MTDRVASALSLCGADHAAAAAGAAALERAAKRIRERAMRRDALPRDSEALRDLEGTAALEDLGELARVAIATAAFSFLPDRFGAPFEASPEWLHSDETMRRIAELPIEVRDGLRRLAAYDILRSRSTPAHPITQGTNCVGVRLTKRGQPPKFDAFDFACCCYVVMLDACKVKPGRTWDAYAGKSTGRFYALLDAALAHHGFDDAKRGRDRLVRDVIDWMAPEGEPCASECDHARARWLAE